MIIATTFPLCDSAVKMINILKCIHKTFNRIVWIICGKWLAVQVCITALLTENFQVGLGYFIHSGLVTSYSDI